MTLVVTDTTCLIALDRIDRLHVLPALFDVVAPPAAVAEFRRRPPWLSALPAADASRVADLKTTLDAGEAEAIALALSLPQTTLLIDEVRGRRVATRLGLDVLGTAGVLLRAKRWGLVPAVRPLRQEHSFRLSDALYAQVAREAGEA